MFEWLMDPTVWAGLLTLILLELVLGIDNLVFIAILADKLPPEQRDRARVIGLSLALLMRLGLLASISWLMGMTQPLFSIADLEVSVRDLILIVGGLFLIYKATSELHEHISPASHRASGKSVVYSSFGVVVMQIVVLDAVFSIDSVITAVGMVQHIEVMMIAVVIAVVVMLIASKPLTVFVSKHPTVILLCLGFLLMIGFSLVCEGLGIHIPKGYLYGAIVFSLLIEMLQELRRRSSKSDQSWRGGRRARTTEAVMRLIGGSDLSVHTNSAFNSQPEHASRGDEPVALFDANERRMVMGVLSLADKPIEAIITLRRELETLDVLDPIEQQLETLANSRHSWLVAIEDGHTDEPLGVISKKRLLAPLLAGEKPDDLREMIEQPLVLLENVSVIDAVEHFRASGKSFAFVVDEFGTLTGIATTTDILEEIAGELPEPGEATTPAVTEVSPDCYDVDASEDIHDINQYLPVPLPTGRDYTTLAGLVLDRLESLPYIGAVTSVEGWRLEVSDVERHRIKRVRLVREEANEEHEQPAH